MDFDDVCDFNGVPYRRSRHPILLLDAGMRVIGANQPALRLLGYQSSELLSKTLLELITASTRPQAGRHWRRLLEGGEQIGEYGLVTRAGGTLEVHYHAVAEVAPGVHLAELTPVSGSTPPER